jgi:hypothetical protein
MQKRERLLAGAVALLAGGWLIDSVVIQPTLAWFAAMEKDTQTATREAGEATVLIDRQTRILADWRGRHAAGLVDNEDQARFRMQRTLQDAAKSSGFTIASVGGGQLVAATQEQVYDLLRLSVSGHGSLEQVQQFVATLESAAQPLRIERAELSSGDARKDALDTALTLSTRLVAESARGGRAVPEGTVAWKPEKRGTALDEAIHDAKPFLADRRHAVARTVRETKEEPTTTVVPTATSKAGWALVGILASAEESVAFLRHQGDGSERVLKTGEQFDGHTVVAVDQHGLRLRRAETAETPAQEQLISVGQDLKGQALDGTITAVRRTNGTSGTSGNGSASSTVSPGAAAAPFQIPTIPTDPAREAILQRLRSQRNRAP